MWLTIGDHTIDKHGDHQLLMIFVSITFSQLFEYCIMYMCYRESHFETRQWLHCGHALDTVQDMAPYQVFKATTCRGRGAWLCARSWAVMHLHIFSLAHPIKGKADDILGVSPAQLLSVII